MRLKKFSISLIGAYFLTTVLLLLLAFLLFRFDLSEKFVDTGIVAIYILASFFGGFLMGKGVHRKKYLWGMLAGMAYFLLLAAVSFLVNKGISVQWSELFSTFFFCLSGGMIGGMVS